VKGEKFISRTENSELSPTYNDRTGRNNHNVLEKEILRKFLLLTSRLFNLRNIMEPPLHESLKIRKFLDNKIYEVHG
jgi:hypothetical protein